LKLLRIRALLLSFRWRASEVEVPTLRWFPVAARIELAASD
jgi:hypothetical protein